jgi:pimeloyl-ACP methyl ester carboxylesterase
MVHGYDGSVGQMAPLLSVTRQHLPDADVLVPSMPYSGWAGRFCLRRPEAIVSDLLRRIDDLVEKRRMSGVPYAYIHFVGYSFGAVLARRLVVLAFGEQKRPDGVAAAPFETELVGFREARPWAQDIGRIVLLAGMNRGWSVSSAMDWLTSVGWNLSQFFAETILRGKPTIMSIRKGARFLVQTRLQWLALMDETYGRRPRLLSVQLLGTIDDWVAPDDNVDFSVDLTSPGTPPSYFYIEVPASGHRSIRDMGTGAATDIAVQTRRRVCFALALLGSREELQEQSIRREDMQDILPPEPDPSVTDLVFVIHGIRDKGFWTQKIARTIKLASEVETVARLSGNLVPPRKFASWTESYGYFAMLPFVFRTTRQRKVEWLMDRYVEARARFPRAVFHYVGHSNGTYLAAEALRDYPSARFERIVFMGSVVRRDYDWLSLMEGGAARRVGAVLNYVATADWVVAIFPNGLQPLRYFNLGSAGHDGFLQAGPQGPVHEVRYVVGGHGAGLEEPHWSDIADFIVRGEPPQPCFPPLSEAQTRRWRIAGRYSPGILLVAGMVILGIGAWLLVRILVGQPTAVEAVERTAVFALYVFVVYIVANRV